MPHECRLAFDAGFMPGEVVARLRDGVPIVCLGRNRTFVSRGLRCCSPDCERAHLAREATAATLAEVGMELPAKRKCQECGGDIPRWTGAGKKRRQVPSSTRFCSPKCRRRAWKRSGAQTVDLNAEEPQKPLRHKGCQVEAA